ncbi:Holliday junction DNA helicase RuvA [Helicobacter sp. CLO-3]|uniref:Holliday junction branch migration protein RuvA n=1 Tax=unclassified Helicobacter TaxID=2593540 RepID=UPI000804DA51|nr:MULTISPECIES: Holliday junction branch migration protein RuvA [unclassified Helicobacter]OBV28931.1 Holliday junction DNA helicase RuvA [Helicobacter sp. CLO-3]OHU81592.1 Holliday junction DNA helicase RuvA [Helicobacter sp. CLO-3]
MICGLVGKVHKLGAMRAEMNVGGVIYSVAISVPTSSQLRAKIEGAGGMAGAVESSGRGVDSARVDSGAKAGALLDSSAPNEVHLLITHIIREDAQLLFGFLDALERATFERLLKINGVGPKVALAILSTFSAQNFAQIVQSKDIKLLQKVPGVGAKSAGKILLDLAGFCKEILESSAPNAETPPQDDAKNEAFLALEALGYKSAEIKKALSQVSANNTQSIIKDALRLLSQGFAR